MKTYQELKEEMLAQARKKFYENFDGGITFDVKMGASGLIFEPHNDKAKLFLNEFPLFVVDVLDTAGTLNDSSIDWSKIILLKIDAINEFEIDVLVVEQT